MTPRRRVFRRACACQWVFPRRLSRWKIKCLLHGALRGPHTLITSLRDVMCRAQRPKRLSCIVRLFFSFVPPASVASLAPRPGRTRRTISHGGIHPFDQLLHDQMRCGLVTSPLLDGTYVIPSTCECVSESSILHISVNWRPRR